LVIIPPFFFYICIRWKWIRPKRKLTCVLNSKKATRAQMLFTQMMLFTYIYICIFVKRRSFFLSLFLSFSLSSLPLSFFFFYLLYFSFNIYSPIYLSTLRSPIIFTSSYDHESFPLFYIFLLFICIGRIPVPLVATRCHFHAFVTNSCMSIALTWFL